MDYESESLKRAQGFLKAWAEVTVDRPLGSRHPEHGFYYPLNYGYIADPFAPDGEALDAYVLGVSEPLESFQGICLAIVHRSNDDDDKLVVVPEGLALSDLAILEQLKFQEQFFDSIIICR